MKVILESSSLLFKNYTGIPNYIYNLYEGLCTIEEIEPVLSFRLKKYFSSRTEFQNKLLEKKHLWHVGNQLVLNPKIDVVHSLHTPFLNHKKALKVATIHDLAVHLPQFENYNFASDYFKKKRMSLFEQFNKKADVLIAVSETTKRDYLSFFDFPEEKIHVVPLAPSLKTKNSNPQYAQLELKKMNLRPKQYFISIGGVSLRKNTFNLIKGFHQSYSIKNHKLVIVGKIESEFEQPIRNYITVNNIENEIIITSYLSNSLLDILYSNASAFLFPTCYEGFGIPILEAMQAKLPVLTSNTGAAPETSNGFAILVNPLDPIDIASGIDKLESVSETTLTNAKDFACTHTWLRTAQMTAEVYNKYL